MHGQHSLASIHKMYLSLSLSLSLSLYIYIYIYIYILDEMDGLKITAIKIVFFGFWVKGMDGK